MRRWNSYFHEWDCQYCIWRCRCNFFFPIRCSLILAVGLIFCQVFGICIYSSVFCCRVRFSLSSLKLWGCVGYQDQDEEASWDVKLQLYIYMHACEIKVCAYKMARKMKWQDARVREKERWWRTTQPSDGWNDKCVVVLDTVARQQRPRRNSSDLYPLAHQSVAFVSITRRGKNQSEMSLWCTYVQTTQDFNFFTLQSPPVPHFWTS